MISDAQHDATIEYLIMCAEDWAQIDNNPITIRDYLEYSLGTTACMYFVERELEKAAENI